MGFRFLEFRISFTLIMLFGVISFSCTHKYEKKRPNVLFIIVDDLRPELGAYHKDHVISPNIDKLAGESILFSRAYCTVPVCGASRASILTGVLPTRTRFTSYNTRADEDAADLLTLPEHFKEAGYITISLGKVFHHAGDSHESWSEKPWLPESEGEGQDYLSSKSIQLRTKAGTGPAWESMDVQDSAYMDGKIANKTISKLGELKSTDQSFFMAVGFYKPHLPFNIPARYWDLYNYDSINLPSNYYFPEKAPKEAWHNYGELRGYAQIPDDSVLADTLAKKLIHGYLASISYVDAQIGRVIKALDDSEMANDTFIVLLGDHGWSLGEHTLWCKHSTFHNVLHSPLMIRSPKHKPKNVDHPVSFVDIYPTICQLTGVSPPAHLQGKELTPLISNSSNVTSNVYARWKAADVLITKKYTFTEWTDNEGRQKARMLYDLENDPGENKNLVKLTDYQDLTEKLQTELQQKKNQAKEPGF